MAAEAAEAVDSALMQLGAEPVLGLSYVREHVERSVPRMISQSATLSRIAATADNCGEDAAFDADRAVCLAERAPLAAESMERSLTRAFKAIEDIRQTKKSQARAARRRRFSFTSSSPSRSSASSSSVRRAATTPTPSTTTTPTSRLRDIENETPSPLWRGPMR